MNILKISDQEYSGDYKMIGSQLIKSFGIFLRKMKEYDDQSIIYIQIYIKKPNLEKFNSYYKAISTDWTQLTIIKVIKEKGIGMIGLSEMMSYILNYLKGFKYVFEMKLVPLK